MILGNLPTGTLQHAKLSGVCFEPLKAQTTDGRPARLAIIDEDGKVIESGDAVSSEVWNLVRGVWRNYLQGKGHIRVISGGDQ